MGVYIGTKLINARVMTRLQYNQLRGWEVPNDENPSDEGYLVEYIDGGKANHPDFAGYISWSPKDVFERAYQPTSGMDFGMALAALKLGKKVCRAGWNGKGIFVYFLTAAACPAQTRAEKLYFVDTGIVPYNPYLAIKNIDETVSTWVPSINDCLATDWQIVE